MKKALKIISVSAGVIGAVSAIIVGYMYINDITRRVKDIKLKISEIKSRGKCLAKSE